MRMRKTKKMFFEKKKLERKYSIISDEKFQINDGRSDGRNFYLIYEVDLTPFKI